MAKHLTQKAKEPLDAQNLNTGVERGKKRMDDGKRPWLFDDNAVENESLKTVNPPESIVTVPQSMMLDTGSKDSDVSDKMGFGESSIDPGGKKRSIGTNLATK